jgi:hypothetical protein
MSQPSDNTQPGSIRQCAIEPSYLFQQMRECETPHKVAQLSSVKFAVNCFVNKGEYWGESMDLI